MTVRLSEVGEAEVIRSLTAALCQRTDVVLGPGDDCAVVRITTASPELILTSDPVIEGVHFTPDTPPSAIGHKAIGRVLSDLAAMGAEPRWALVNLVAPGDTPLARVTSVYEGMRTLADTFDLSVVGGDVATGPHLALHVFAVGAVPAGMAVTRGGGREGDMLYVTGQLGGSRGGRHLAFTPRVCEGRWLRNRVTAMTDISDGLATDLQHLCTASGLGADVDQARVPISDAARALDDDRSPLEHALSDGEDFELLFAVPPEQASTFASAWSTQFDLPCARIGQLTAQPGIMMRGPGNTAHPLRIKGYEHFAD